MSSELVTLNESPQYLDTGLDDIAPLRPSFLQFLQPSTNDLHGGEPGQFYDEATGDLYDSLVVVPLKVTQNRVMYPPGADVRAGVKPLCRSDDGQVPSRYIETPQSRSCQTCQFSQWKDDKPSACKSNIKMLVLLKDREAPRFVVASGTSVSPLRTLLRRINEDLKAQNMKGNPVRLYDYFFTVASERKRNYFLMTFAGVSRVKELGEFSGSFEQFVRTASAPQQEEGDTVDAEIVDI